MATLVVSMKSGNRQIEWREIKWRVLGAALSSCTLGRAAMTGCTYIVFESDYYVLCVFVVVGDMDSYTI